MRGVGGLRSGCLKRVGRRGELEPPYELWLLANNHSNSESIYNWFALLYSFHLNLKYHNLKWWICSWLWTHCYVLLRSLLQGRFQTKLDTINSFGTQIKFEQESKYFPKKKRLIITYFNKKKNLLNVTVLVKSIWNMGRIERFGRFRQSLKRLEP